MIKIIIVISYLLVQDKIQVKGALTRPLLRIFFGFRRSKREQQKSKEKYAKTHFCCGTCHPFLFAKTSIRNVAKGHSHYPQYEA